MAQSACSECGAQVFLGEAKCASCGARTPDTVSSFGQGVDRGGHTPPPEGLDLIVQKGMADIEARDRSREKAERGVGEEGGLVVGGARALWSMSEVERDRDGKVVWDPKHAIIGGIVVAIFVALVAGWLFMSVKNAGGVYTPPTSIR